MYPKTCFLFHKGYSVVQEKNVTVNFNSRSV